MSDHQLEQQSLQPKELFQAISKGIDDECQEDEGLYRLVAYHYGDDEKPTEFQMGVNKERQVKEIYRFMKKQIKKRLGFNKKT